MQPHTDRCKQQLTQQTSTIALAAKTLAPSLLKIKIKLYNTPLKTDIALYWSAPGAEPPRYEPRISLPDSDTHCTLLRCRHTAPAQILKLAGTWYPASYIAQPETGSYYLRVALPSEPDSPLKLIVATTVATQ